MTIRKFLWQLSFIFALIIGLVACEKDLATDPITNNITEQSIGQDDDDSDDTDTTGGGWCGGHDDWGDWMDAHGEHWGDWEGDWQSLCDSLVASWADQLDSLGIDWSTWCDSLDGDWGDWHGHGNCNNGHHHDDDDYGDWEFNCDSLVEVYADQLEQLGLDPETLCDSLDGDWGDWHGNWGDWGNDDDDGWGNHDDDDWGGEDIDCDSLVSVYADQLEQFGLDPETLCDSLDGNWGDWHGNWGDWGNDDDDDDTDDDDDSDTDDDDG